MPKQPTYTNRLRVLNSSFVGAFQKRWWCFTRNDFEKQLHAVDACKHTCMLWPESQSRTKKTVGTASMLIGSTLKCWYRRLTQLHSTPITRHGKHRKRSLLGRYGMYTYDMYNTRHTHHTANKVVVSQWHKRRQECVNKPPCKSKSQA